MNINGFLKIKLSKRTPNKHSKVKSLDEKLRFFKLKDVHGNQVDLTTVSNIFTKDDIVVLIFDGGSSIDFKYKSTDDSKAIYKKAFALIEEYKRREYRIEMIDCGLC